MRMIKIKEPSLKMLSKYVTTSTAERSEKEEEGIKKLSTKNAIDHKFHDPKPKNPKCPYGINLYVMCECVCDHVVAFFSLSSLFFLHRYGCSKTF